MDTNVFIAGFELPLEQAKPVQDVLAALRDKPRLAVTSELTLGELLAPVSRYGAMPFPVKRRLYLNLLVWSRLVEMRPVTRDILIETADLRQATPKQRLPDAIHVVTAIQSGCGYFLTGDKRIKTPRGMTLVSPDRAGADLILDLWSGRV
jgi:predicted nucleic acid-binding protein